MPPRTDEAGGALTAADIRILREMMVEVAAETAAQHVCRFTAIGDKEAREIIHAAGMLADIGDGDMRAGVETIRENHQWTSRVRDRMDKVGLAAFISGIGIVIAAVIGSLWVGFKTAVLK